MLSLHLDPCKFIVKDSSSLNMVVETIKSKGNDIVSSKDLIPIMILSPAVISV